MPMLRSRPKKSKKPEIVWAGRPLYRIHDTLGRKRIWIETLRAYYVTHFPEASGLYVAWHHETKLAEKHSLAAAKRICLSHLRASGELRT